MIERYLKYDNMHIFGMINAFNCINNHVISCINSILSVYMYVFIDLFMYVFTYSYSSKIMKQSTCYSIYIHIFGDF